MPDQDAVQPAELGIRLASYGTYFATRGNAQEIRQNAHKLLAEHPDARLILDFESVQAITNSWADEMVADLLEQHGERVYLTGCSDDVQEAIDTVLARRSLPALDWPKREAEAVPDAAAQRWAALDEPEARDA